MIALFRKRRLVLCLCKQVEIIENLIYNCVFCAILMLLFGLAFSFEAKICVSYTENIFKEL